MTERTIEISVCNHVIRLASFSHFFEVENITVSNVWWCPCFLLVFLVFSQEAQQLVIWCHRWRLRDALECSSVVNRDLGHMHMHVQWIVTFTLMVPFQCSSGVTNCVRGGGNARTINESSIPPYYVSEIISAQLFVMCEKIVHAL